VIEGALREVPLTDVVQVVAGGRKDGVLRVEHRDQHAQLWFERGRLRAATLSGGTHLGEVLVRLDLLDVDEVQTLLAEQASAETPVPIGALAVTHGWIDRSDLKRALERHIVEVLGVLLGWRDGHFAFGEGDQPLRDPDGPRFDAMQVLLQAEEARAGAGAIDPHGVLQRIGDPTASELPPAAWELLGLIDGRRSAQALAAESDLAEGTTYGLLAELVAAGVVAPVPDPVAPPLVLVVSGDETERRLLRLTLLRHGVRPQLLADVDAADAAFGDHRPSAVIVDARLAPWTWLRALRRRSEGSHVPVLLLGDVDCPWCGSVWGRRRGVDGDRLARPYREADVQAWLDQRLATGSR
jgi:hypothetical protein